jgi:pimeloyl-ACP methyl ester carboxylesterase
MSGLSRQHRTWRRVLVGLGVLAALLAIGTLGLERVGAWAIVRAPNAGRLPAEGPLAVEVHEVSAPRATIFVLHGIRDRKESMRGWAAHLQQAGYRVVLVDAVGHGASPGEWLSYGVFDARALSQLLDRPELGTAPIGVMGISYGAATAIEWAGREPRVAAVVAVAPFESLRKVVPNYAPRLVPVVGRFIPNVLIQRTVDRAGRLGGYDPDEASPAAAIARTQAPILLLHGDQDHHIPAAHSVALQAASGHRAELVTVVGATHDTIAGRAELWPPTLQFFRQHLGTAAGRRP